MNIPDFAEISACVIFDASPFGKKETFSQKAFKTIKIFGLGFFINYGFKYVINKIAKDNIKTIIKKHGIKHLKIDGSINSEKSLEKIKNLDPDLLISIAGNQIFKKDLINLAPKGCLNLHTAMLPKYRGLMPSFWVLKNNEKETAVSVFFVDEGIDSGDILIQDKIEITPQTTQQQLIEKSKRLGMIAIIKAIRKIESGKFTLIPNDNSKSSYYSFPEKKDVRDFLNKGKRFY